MLRVDWASIEAHTSLSHTPKYASLNKELFPLFAPVPPAPAPYMFHAWFPATTKVWERGIVKVITFYVSPERVSKETKDAFAGISSREEMADDVKSMKDVAGGWVEESMPQDVDDMEKCKVFVLASAWSDLQKLKEGERRYTDGILEAVDRLCVTMRTVLLSSWVGMKNPIPNCLC